MLSLLPFHLAVMSVSCTFVRSLFSPRSLQPLFGIFSFFSCRILTTLATTTNWPVVPVAVFSLAMHDQFAEQFHRAVVLVSIKQATISLQQYFVSYDLHFRQLPQCSKWISAYSLTVINCNAIYMTTKINFWTKSYEKMKIFTKNDKIVFSYSEWLKEKTRCHKPKQSLEMCISCIYETQQISVD